MNNYLNIQKRFVLISVLAHLVLFSFIIYTQQKKAKSNKVIISATIIQAVDADVVGLPNILKKDVSKITEKETKINDSNFMELPNLKKLAVSKMKAVEQLKKEISDSEYLKKIKIIKGLKAGKSLNKQAGQLSTSPGIGISSSQNKSGEINFQYIEDIKTLIKKFWLVPTWMNIDGLKTSIVLTLEEDGSIKVLELYESSGNSDFDKLSLDAVNKSAPFQAPPANLKDLLVQDGIILVFP